MPHAHNLPFGRNGNSSGSTGRHVLTSLSCGSWLREPLLIINLISMSETSCRSHFIHSFILEAKMEVCDCPKLKPWGYIPFTGFAVTGSLLCFSIAKPDRSVMLGHFSKALNKTSNFIFYICYTEWQAGTCILQTNTQL